MNSGSEGNETRRDHDGNGDGNVSAATETAPPTGDEAIQQRAFDDPPADPLPDRPGTSRETVAPAEPEPTRAPTPTPTKKKRGGGGFLWVLLLLALIGGGGYATRDLWYDRVADALPFIGGKGADTATTTVATDAVPPSSEPVADMAPDAPAVAEDSQTATDETVPDETVPEETAGDAAPDAVTAAEATAEPATAEAEAVVEAGPPEDTAGVAVGVTAVEQQLRDVAEHVARFEARLGAIEARLASIAPDSLARLPERMERLEAGVRPVATIESRLAALEGVEGATRSTVERETALVLAVGQTAQAVSTSGAYGDQLAALRTAAGDDPDLRPILDRLARHAADGVPTEDVLRARFPGVARDVIRAEQGPSGEGWVARIGHRLASLVTIRRTGDAAVAAGGSEAALAEAQAALDGGDLVAAVAALQRLDGVGLAAAEPWLAAGQARIDVDAAVDSLHATALSRLAAPRG